MAQSFLTSVIVVAANSGATLLQCVAGALASNVEVELIVVDNASTDGAIQLLAKLYAHDSRVRIIQNKKNMGFGPACNLAAHVARGDTLLVLNPDCYLKPQTVCALRNALVAHPEAGVIGALIRNPDGTMARANRRRAPTLRRSLMTLTGLARLEQRYPWFEGIELPPRVNSSVMENIEAVSGALLFFSRNVFERVGGFDAQYFLHCEDLDLCQRVRELGFKVLFAGDIEVIHVQGSSSRSRPVFVSWHKHRGMWRYFRKFDEAAKNPALSSLVWCGIWMHFVALLPVNVGRKFLSRHRS